MESLDNFSIHNIALLRAIEEQAKLARKADGIDDEFTRYKRLAFHHLEVAANALIKAIEEERDIL